MIRLSPYSPDMFNFLNGMSSPRSSSSSLQNDEDSGTLLVLFESFVSNQKTSENVALCTEMGVQLSYTQLNDKAEVLSSHINSHIAQDGKPHLVGNLRICFYLHFDKFVVNFLTLIVRHHDGKGCRVHCINTCFIEISNYLCPCRSFISTR